MQRHRLIELAADGVEGGETHQLRVGLAGTQVILADFSIEPLTCESERVFKCAVGFDGIAEGVKGVVFYDGSAFIRYLANRAETVVQVEVFLGCVVAVLLHKDLAILSIKNTISSFSE
jgi:hypothetical protein